MTRMDNAIAKGLILFCLRFATEPFAKAAKLMAPGDVRREAMRYPAGLVVRLCVTILIGLVLVLPGQPIEAQETGQAEVREGEVVFLTLRNRTGSEDPAEYFGDQRSELRAGMCRTRTLDFGAMDLGVLAPLVDQVPAYVREELGSVDAIAEAPVRDVIDGRLNAPSILYIHGYNLGFRRGCLRAALLQSNATLSDRMVWFSWPSDGAIANYTRDESDLYWSVPDIAQAILDLDDATDAPLQVMGHSLGARGLVIALYEVANRRPDARIGKVVLLAPDMDFQIFERMLPRIASISESITVYVADGDRPLALSTQLNGYPRLGESGNDVSRLTGVEVIDVRMLEVEDLTGHLYHIFSPEVGRDLDRLLNEGALAATREGLEHAGPNLWLLTPGPSSDPE